MWALPASPVVGTLHSLPKAQVQSLVEELNPNKRHGRKKKERRKRKRGQKVKREEPSVPAAGSGALCSGRVGPSSENLKSWGSAPERRAQVHCLGHHVNRLTVKSNQGLPGRLGNLLAGN